MRLSQYIDRGPQGRRKRKTKGRKPSIATHGAFVPILTLWGMALFGLAVMVLPDAMVARMSVLLGGFASGDVARLAFAGIAALLGGALAFVVGGAWRSKALRNDSGRPITAAISARRVSPIDPATELGSESLDSPLEGMPFGADESDEAETIDFEPAPIAAQAGEAKSKPTLGELAERNYELEAPAAPTKKGAKKDSEEIAFTHRQFQSALIESCEGATCEAAPSAEAETRMPRQVPVEPPVGQRKVTPIGRKSATARAPRALDLEEFGRLPGRNAVWVEEPAPTPSAKHPLVPASALEKLRQTPPDELSLVEMVERFAGALHEHQQSEHTRRPDGGAGRDAALVEALKALTLFTEQGFNVSKPKSSATQLSETERELRNALAKLQTLRGAA